MLQIKALQTPEELRQFIEMPWKIYQQDHNWVPPLKKKLLEELNGKNNILLMNGAHQFLMAYRNNKPVARILVGINEKLNREKNKREGYISLFESINDPDICFPLLEQALEWLKEKGIRKVVGPISPTNGDENRGLLIKGYSGPPVLMNAYNPDYYPELLEQFGFKKYLDFFAYYLDEDLIKDE
ncbi:MAG: N-acetyltransferase, partial [Atribacterota bacterium]|nr:N-acetyltransferase [Atribacterota bacterium]